MTVDLKNIRCDHCGRFIAFAAIENGTAHQDFTPDNAFGREEIYWVCPRCYAQEKQKEKVAS